VRRLLVALIVLVVTPVAVQPVAVLPQAPAEAWIERSNENAQLLLEIDAHESPELASERRWDVDVDDEISQFTSERRALHRNALEAARAELTRRLGVESDTQVATDIRVLLASVDRERRRESLAENGAVAFVDLTQLVANGITSLLNERRDPHRDAALTRGRKYAGLEPGYVALVDQAKVRARQWPSSSLGPSRRIVEEALNGVPQTLRRFEEALTRSGFDVTADPWFTLRRQLDDYHRWLRTDVLPSLPEQRTRTPEAYAYMLDTRGVHGDAAQLAALGHAAFDEAKGEMEALVPAVARSRGIPAGDYRTLIHTLKREQWPADRVVQEFEQRTADLATIVRTNRLVTVPPTPVRIVPGNSSPMFVMPPELRPNRSQRGSVVVPNGRTPALDDFNYPAASWTLMAHEAMPGHAMQFSVMIDHAYSIARRRYAFNSANVEGWGLYAEDITRPFMPVAGQFVSLQYLMFRGARAFLDAELQLGRITKEEARRVLTDDVVMSGPFADSELRNYTEYQPGWAPSYLYGRSEFQRLRADVRARLGARFDQRAFHDFVLEQGELPLDLLRDVTMKEFAR
jgi:hypothetical protein